MLQLYCITRLHSSAHGWGTLETLSPGGAGSTSHPAPKVSAVRMLRESQAAFGALISDNHVSVTCPQRLAPGSLDHDKKYGPFLAFEE